MTHRHCLPNHYLRVPVLFLRDMHCKCCKSTQGNKSIIEIQNQLYKNMIKKYEYY